MDKVILLKGYKDLAHEIHSLNLPQLEIEGVFIQKKLYTNGTKKAKEAAAAAAAGGMPSSTPKTSSPNPPKKLVVPIQEDEPEKAQPPKPSTPAVRVVTPATPVKKPRPLDPSQVRSSIFFIYTHVSYRCYSSLCTSVSASES